MRTQGTPAELSAGHPPEDAFMVPGMGYQPVPDGKYVAGNDNEPKLWGCEKKRRMPDNHPVCMPDFAVDLDDEVRAIFDAVDLEMAMEMFGPLEVTECDFKQTPADFQLDTRHGDFMQTYTARKFWPMDPRPNEVNVFDIAHSLSLQCRYAGHCKRFYSVAEHSTLIARYLRGKYDAPTAMWGLLHDAAEAYLVDVPRPVKPFLTGYKAAEAAVMRAVCIHFGLPVDAPPEVHEADTRIIADELINLRPMDWHGRHTDGLGVPMMYWTPGMAEVEFLATYRALAKQIPGMWEEVA